MTMGRGPGSLAHLLDMRPLQMDAERSAWEFTVGPEPLNPWNLLHRERTVGVIGAGP